MPNTIVKVEIEGYEPFTLSRAGNLQPFTVTVFPAAHQVKVSPWQRESSELFYLEAKPGPEKMGEPAPG